MPAAIDFYFDFSSPYGYFASTRVNDIAERHGRTVNWRPILLGAAFKVTGQQPLPSIPLKGDYAKRDLDRTARLMRVPYRFPSRFPIAAQAPSRAFYWAHDRDRDLAVKLAQALYRAYFAEDHDISSPEVTASVASTFGLDREAVLSALGDSRVKDRLRTEVDTAIQRGVFGSPYIVIDGEPFWGADHLDQVERWLATGGW